MAKTTTCPIAQTIQNTAAIFVNADGACGTTSTTTPSNTKLLFTAGAEGSVVKSISVSSDDTTSRIAVFYISYDAGTTKYLLAAVSIAAGSGTTGSAAAVDILGSTVLPGLPQDQSGRSVLELMAGARIYVGVQVAVTAAKTLVVIVQAEDY